MAQAERSVKVLTEQEGSPADIVQNVSGHEGINFESFRSRHLEKGY